MQLTHDFPPPPEPVACKADVWRAARKLSVAELARTLKVTQQQLEQCFLPPDHERFVEAPLPLRKKMKAYSRGEITLDDWPERAIAREVAQ